MKLQIKVEELEKLINENSDVQIELRYQYWKTDFLRFYKSQVNYNITKTEIMLAGTVERNKKKYTFELSDPTLTKLKEAISDAKKIIEHLPEDPDFSTFEDNKDEFTYDNFNSSVEKTSLEQKVRIIKEIAASAHKHGFSIYGTFITLCIDTRIVNSNGISKRFFQAPVMIDLKCVSSRNMATVIDSYAGNDLSEFSTTDFIRHLEEKIAYALLDIADISPGVYDAVLSPHAVSQFLQYFIASAYASSLDRGVSFFEGKIDKKIFPEILSISSLPTHPKLITVPYNSDGHIAQDLSIIHKGVFKEFIVDNYYAHKLKMKKNGAVGDEALVLHAGEDSMHTMMGDMESGLYISNVHYMNFINQKESSVTGLTRDGTFLVKNGKVKNIANNLRYTLKISDIFEHIEAVEKKQYCIPISSNYENFSIASVLAPHIRTGMFKISSSTGTI
ncbi:TldD/PmbA family protein [Spirochaetota bacterium]